MLHARSIAFPLTTTSACSLFLVMLTKINQHDKVYILRPSVVNIGLGTEIESLFFQLQTNTTKIMKSTWPPSNTSYGMIHERAGYLILYPLQYLLCAIYNEHHEPSMRPLLNQKKLCHYSPLRSTICGFLTLSNLYQT
jgi:hypothetical protein